MVADALTETGRVFLIDERPAAAADERVISDAAAPAVARPLSDGTRYRAVKVSTSQMICVPGWPISAGP
jgi:hypothetical protein